MDFDNLKWFIFGGILLGSIWFIFGLIWCITIVGQPLGKRCFEVAYVVLFPYGKEIEYDDPKKFNVRDAVWLGSSGILILAVSLLTGVVLCASIIGIPYGLQCFKMARISIMPFDINIYDIDM